MYYDFQHPINKMVSHRILATNRGEQEDILKVALVADEEKIMDYLRRKLITNRDSPAAGFVEAAAADALKRFISPAIEREIRNELTE